MILHDYFRSSAAYRVRIALNLKGLAPERRFVHLLQGEQRNAGYRAVNPQGLVPALEDGGRVFTQSLAIIEYLDETHPEPALLPNAPADRAWVRAFAQAAACDIHPLNNLRVLNYLRDTLGHDEPTRNAWYAHWIREGFLAMEAMLAARQLPSAFCFGDAPTLADVCLIPQVANAQRFKCPMDDYPLIRAIHERAMALPAFDLAQPSKQPDFPKEK
ncbi:MAG: maleylacetoacetate isomerase [Betaproteobacteria bacterium]|nr:maleylacetoacetate isomerase [Betaproteobacteria bacterium]